MSTEDSAAPRRIASLTARFDSPDVRLLLDCAGVGVERTLVSGGKSGMGVEKTLCDALLETERGFVSFALRKPARSTVTFPSLERRWRDVRTVILFFTPALLLYYIISGRIRAVLFGQACGRRRGSGDDHAAGSGGTRRRK
jgi:hypothetical protein